MFLQGKGSKLLSSRKHSSYWGMFLKLLCLLLSVIGIVHLESMAYDAILDIGNWCGTPRIKRGSVAMLYMVIVLPAAIFVFIKTRKQNTLLDRIIRITVLSLVASLIIYYFFENHSNTVLGVFL